MVEIARDVAASEALIYRYFPSKADLYVEVLNLSVHDLTNAMVRVNDALPADTDWPSRLSAVVEAYLNYLSHDETSWLTQLLLGGNEPPEATAARHKLVSLDSDLLLAEAPKVFQDFPFAIETFLTFLDGIATAWVRTGCDPAKLSLFVKLAVEILNTTGQVLEEHIQEAQRPEK